MDLAKQAGTFLMSTIEREPEMVYVVPTNWWNDFQSFMLIAQEESEFEIEGGSEFLSSQNKFDNSPLIKEGDFEVRTLLKRKMQELTKDHIKILHDYFIIGDSFQLNSNYSLIGSKAYHMISQLTGGGPHVRYFVSQSAQQKTKSKRILHSGADCLTSDQFVDLDVILLGIIIKHLDKATVEVGYYPSHASLKSILQIVGKWADMSPFDKQIVEVRNEKGTLYQKNIDGDNQSMSLYELGVEQGQILVLSVDGGCEEIEKRKEEQERESFLEDEEWQQLEKLGDAQEERKCLQSEGIKQVNLKSIQKEQNVNYPDNSSLGINQQKDSFHLSEEKENSNESQNTLSQTFDTPAQVHNNSMQQEEEDGYSNFAIPQARNNLDESTEESEGFTPRNNKNFDIHQSDYFQLNNNTNPQALKQPWIGRNLAQDEIERVKKEVQYNIDKSGSLQLPNLHPTIILQNLSFMINQLGAAIKENQQRAKQEQAILLQSEQEKRQPQEVEDSVHTSSTSTQSENDDQYDQPDSQASHNNLLFDESNILDADQIN